MKQLLRLAGAMCAVAAMGLAQTDNGGVTGAVSDPAGAAVANAVVEVRNVNTGTIFRGGSSNTGNFVIPVPTGTYELTVEVPGFKKFARPGIVVPVATTVRADVVLEVGAATETVTVSAGTPLLQTESGELSHNVAVDTLNALPILNISNGVVRSPYATLNLLPGTNWQNNFDVRINGMPSNTQSLKIDGQDATNSLWQVQTSQTQPSVDAVQEVAVQTSNYAAEFGQAGGAVVNLTMRSGTNTLHGSAYDYLTNEDLNAGLPYTSDGQGGHIRNRSRVNDYGFTIGGPVVIPKIYNGHDRTFFFFNWEQLRNNVFTANTIDTVPTDALKSGNFSLANQGLPPTPNVITTDPTGQQIYQGEIFDPASETVVNGFRVRSPFPNNVIPMSRMDPVALKIQAMFPEANGAGQYLNYFVPTYENKQHTTIPGFKVDHSLSPTQKLSIYYSLNKQTAPNPNGLPQPIAGTTPTDQRTHTTRINYDNTIRPTLLLHVGVGLLHTVVNNQAQPYDSAAQLGFTGQYSKLFPYITGLGAGVVGSQGGFYQGVTGNIGPGALVYLTNDKPTANVSLTWIRGNHIYKAGGELVINGFPAVSTEYTNAWLTFSNAETNSPYLLSVAQAPVQAGHNYASFLLGGVDSGIIGPAADTRLGQHSVGLFLQDTWKVTRRLTLDYGLRWDYSTYLKEQYGRIANFSPSTFNPTVGLNGGVDFEGSGPGHCNCNYAKNYPYAFGPRLGVAYQITPKTVIRGGVALSYSKTAEDGYLSYSIGGLNNFGTPTPDTAFFNLAGGIPAGLQNLPFPNLNPGQYPTVIGGVENLNAAPAFYIDRNAGRPGRIFQWSIGVQRELTSNIVVQAAYVGNRGAWWQAGLTPANLIPLANLAADGLNLSDPRTQTLLTLPLNSATVQAAGFSAPYSGFPLSQSLAQSLRPFPQFTSALTPLWAPVGKNWYDSLQAGATKRFSHGFDMQATFTFQKILDIGAENSYPLGAVFGGGPVAVMNNLYDYGSNKYLSRDDFPLQFVFSGSYTTPQWHVNKVVNQIVHNWRISTVLRYQSGALMVIPGTNNNLAADLPGVTTYATRNPGVPLFLKDPNCHCFDPTSQLVLNPAAFSQTPAGQFTASTPYYNDFRWQRQPMESMSLGRIFAFGHEGRYNVEVRGEFTNIFNRHFYPAPTQPLSLTTPTTTGAAGQLTGGYGFVNTAGGAGDTPRTGQIVARFRF